MTSAEAPRVLYVAEPPAAFLGRPPMVVDCSVLSAVLFEEETRTEALRIITGKTLHAPYLLNTEIVSVALKKSRSGVPEALISIALTDFARQAIERHHPEVGAQFDLAVRYDLSAYDAAYLWLAGFLQAPLATFDTKLAKAARAHLSGPR